MSDPRRTRRGLDQARHSDGNRRRWPSSFADRLTAPLPGCRDVAALMHTRPDESGTAPNNPVGVVPMVQTTTLPEINARQTAATWIGHATYLLRTGGLTILTDPVWSRRIPGVRPRITPPGLDLGAIPRVDAVVISHNHYDHLDAPTIRRLPRSTPVLVPGGLGSWFTRRGFARVTELDWWETARLSDVEFTFVPAHHWSRRGVTDTCRTLWGGWLTRAGDTTIHVAGDSGYGHWFTEIGRRRPGIDLTIMPIGAYEPRWFMKPVHMNPAEAVRACADVGAQRMATMHWGTFALSAEPLLAPLREVVAAWAATGRPREDLWDLAIGETRIL